MKRPELYIFAISHYCEKARWALDFLDIEYELKHIAPGANVKFSKQLGAPRSSVPILVNGEEHYQGSEAILDWAIANTSGGNTLLVDEELRQQSQAFNQRLDDVIGVHVRRYYYSEALVEYPATVRPIFNIGLPISQKLMIRMGWSKIRAIMIRFMDLGYEQGLESIRIIEAELDWLDGLLSDGREFLIGDSFSRTDIAAASLLAPLVLPAEHPTYTGLTIPPRIAVDRERWANRPVFGWVRNIYHRYR